MKQVIRSPTLKAPYKMHCRFLICEPHFIYRLTGIQLRISEVGRGANDCSPLEIWLLCTSMSLSLGWINNLNDGIWTWDSPDN
jgi:hypothetical protein